MNFLWNNGKYFLAKYVICSSSENGGLGMINIQKILIAIECNWLKLLTNNQDLKLKSIVGKIIPDFGHSFWEGNFNPFHTVRDHL